MVVLVECVVLCVLFTVAVVIVSLKNPLTGVHNWPQRVSKGHKSLG